MIYVNLGRREQGKTTLAAYLMRRANAPLDVVFDPRGLFPGPRVETQAQVGTAFFEAEEKERGRIVVTPEGNLQRTFEQTCGRIKEWLANDVSAVSFLVDEARMLDTRIDQFDWLLRCATRSSITIILTAHRPKDVPVDVRAIADMWCVFPTTQAHDFEVFDEQFNVAAVNAIRRLKERQFVAWDETTATFKIYEDPALWYVPLATAGARPHRELLEGGKEPPPEKDLLSNL